MTTLNHLKKGESLANKQLVIINSDDRDITEQNSSSFTYTFNEPIERVSKIDIIYSKIPNTIFNVNDDQASMSITTQTFSETHTNTLVVDDNEITKGVIQSTNIIDGTFFRSNIINANNCTISDIYIKNADLYIIGTFNGGTLDLYNFTDISAKKILTNNSNTDIYVAKYNLEQELIYRFKIAGNSDVLSPKLIVTESFIYISAIFNSFPLQFFNTTDVFNASNNLASNGQYTGLLTKYSTTGEIQWRVKIEGINSNQTPMHIVYDETLEHIYVSCEYNKQLKFYGINDVLLSQTLAEPTNTSTFLAQYSINGTLNWVTHCTAGTICKPTDIKFNTNVLVSVNFNDTISLYHATNHTTVVNSLISDGIENIAILDYTTTGSFANYLKIGGTSVDNNAIMGINNNQLIITGTYTSNPVKFYQSNNTFSLTQSNINVLNNMFIVSYDITTLNAKTTNWSTKIICDNTVTNADISITTDSDIIISGYYNNLLKFYDISGYSESNDILNTSSSNDVFIAKYDINGNIKNRTYTKSNNIVTNTIVNTQSNNIYISASYTSDLIVYNSDNTIAKTITNLGTQNSSLISFINNIDNYFIDTTTLDKLIISKPLTGSDLNYTLNLNNFSQLLGFDASKKFRATVFGTSINWETKNIDNTNDILTIQFIIADITQNAFNTYVRNFKITNIVSGDGYTPYNMAFELNAIIKNTLKNDTDVVYDQLFNPVIYDSIQDIFYIQFNINGNFSVINTTLSNSDHLNITSIDSSHVIISDSVNTEINISIADNSKLLLKLTDDITTQVVNNGSFNDAFPEISNSSNQLLLSVESDNTLNANTVNTSDNLSNINAGDNITFESPWLSNNTFSNNYLRDNRTWQAIAMSDDGVIQTAVVDGGQIYVSYDSGATWTAKESNRSWRSVAMSTDGANQTAVAYGGHIYRSPDSGNTWTEVVVTIGVKNWSSVAMSSNGINQIAVVSGGQIYVSVDTGVNWVAATTQPITSANWTSVAMSSDGTKRTAVVGGGNIWVSINSGVNWTEITTLVGGTKPWTSVAMSDNGDIQTAIASNGQIYVSTNTGVTWGLPTTSPPISSSLRSVSMSADGTKQTAVVSGGQIYVSIDTGNTWTAKASTRTWRYVTMSSDGTKQTAVETGGQIWVSTNSGESWNILGYDIAYNSIAMSADGSKQTTVVFGGQIYVSLDTGVTWTPKESNRNWVSVAMSADGTKQTAVVSGGQIYVSIDTGNTWTAKESNRNWSLIAMSADGSIQTAVVYGGHIYVSTDTNHNTWSEKIIGGSSKNWRSVALSANGERQTAVVQNGHMYISTNSGAIWSEKIIGGTIKKWFSVAMSTDGNIQTAVVYGGQIYISTDAGGTWTAKDSDRNWISVAMSANGSIQTAVVEFGQIYGSIDNGNTWTAKDSIRFWTSIATSSNGVIQTAVVQNGQIYISTDAGVTWITKESNRNWTSVAMSADGSKQTAVNYGGNIYVSEDSGNTWNAKITVGSRNWSVVAMSSDGTKQTAVVLNGQIYVSDNSWTTWTAKEFNRDWRSVAMSADGTKQTAVVSGGQIYVSDNTGVSWAAATTQPTSANWWSIAMSADGSIQTAVVNGGQIYVSTDTNHDIWTAKASTASWQSITMSADGSIQTAVISIGQIYVSTDTNHDTWTAKDSNRPWRSVSMSSDGSIQTANTTNGQIYVSTDSGNIWKPINFVPIISYTNNWFSVAMSDDGIIQTAVVVGGQIFVSIDSGNTWTAKENNRNWWSIAMSADGSIQTAVVNGGQIYVSTDTGNTWTSKASSSNWRSVAMSADGVKQTAVINNGQIWVSTDIGVTWTAKESDKIWSSVAMSDDGINQIAVVLNGQIYVSTDSGNTWTAKESNRQWRSVSMSADGSTQTAVDSDGQIYTHPFPIDYNIDLTVKSVESGNNINDKIYFNETTTITPLLLALDGFNMANALNYNIVSTQDSGLTNLYLPNGDYTPTSMKDKLNALILAINPLYINPFSYDDITKKISFTSKYSGTNVLSTTNLLNQLGITEIPSSITAGTPIVGTNNINVDFTGPLNVFIKSDILSALRKTQTPFSKNKNIQNIISPLELLPDSNYYNIPTTVELFLSKKSTISTFDIQIVDENGNIINLNGSPIRINLYFYIS